MDVILGVFMVKEVKLVGIRKIKKNIVVFVEYITYKYLHLMVRNPIEE